MPAEKPRIFISHAWEEKARVQDLERSMKAAGVEVWVDHSDVRGGDNFPKRISDALTWCNTLLLVWSEHGAGSPWVEQEWTCAMALQKSIIPCKTDQTPLPGILANRRHIDLQDPERGLKEILNALDITLPVPGPVAGEEGTKGLVTLRSRPLESLSSDAVQEMLTGLRFTRHGYEEGIREDQKLVIDRATGLMWQQSGSGRMPMGGPPHYIAKLNHEKFAGCSDWRMPTLEEAMFLVEPTQKHDKLYIDSVFDSEQTVIWTADKKALWIWWAVSFADACCFGTRVEDFFHVRAVRRMPE